MLRQRGAAVGCGGSAAIALFCDAQDALNLQLVCSPRCFGFYVFAASGPLDTSIFQPKRQSKAQRCKEQRAAQNTVKEA